MTLREQIIQYRQDHNLSQRAFAEKCNLTNGYISMIEKNVNPSTGKPLIPTFSSIKKLAAGMEMSVHQLIRLVDDMEIDIGEETPEIVQTVPRIGITEYSARRVFNTNLKRILVEKNLTLDALAEISAFPYSLVSDWYSGKKYPHDTDMYHLAECLDVSIEDLTTYQGNDQYRSLTFAYERACIEERQQVCSILRLNYIPVRDDRELVYCTRIYLDQISSGEKSYSVALDEIRNLYILSQQHYRKGCTPEIYNLCIQALNDNDPSILDKIRYDDNFHDDFAPKIVSAISSESGCPPFFEFENGAPMLSSRNARSIFKDNLQRILRERDMSQSDLAARLGRSNSIVSDWCNGKKYPRVEALQQIAHACGVSFEELTGRSPAPTE